jgi:hypothetical protein
MRIMNTRSHPLLCLLLLALGGVISCSSPKSNVAGAKPGMAEYDPASASWKPTTRVVVPPPSQNTPPMVVAKSAPVQPKEGILTKMGRTMKKPLQWLPWTKEETTPLAQPQASAR